MQAVSSSRPSHQEILAAGTRPAPTGRAELLFDHRGKCAAAYMRTAWSEAAVDAGVGHRVAREAERSEVDGTVDR